MKCVSETQTNEGGIYGARLLGRGSLHCRQAVPGCVKWETLNQYTLSFCIRSLHPALVLPCKCGGSPRIKPRSYTKRCRIKIWQGLHFVISFEMFHKAVEFANGNSSFPERSIFIEVTKLQIGKYSLHGSQPKSPHSAKMHSIPDPWLPVMWTALRVVGVPPRPIKHSLFPMFDPSDVRMNDPLGCCRADQVTKPPKGRFRISEIRPDGDETNSCTFPESLEQLILE